MRWVWLLLGLAGIARAEVVVATVSDLRGTVELRRAKAEVFAPAVLDGPVHLKDTVQTRAQSAAELAFVDGSVLGVGAQTRLVVSRFLFDSSQAPPEVQILLAAGELQVEAAATPIVVAHGAGAVRVGPGEVARLRAGEGGLARLPALPRATLPDLQELPGPRGPGPRDPDPAPGWDQLWPGRPLPGDLRAPGGEPGGGGGGETRLQVQPRVRP